jgi:hypothetical protein
MRLILKSITLAATLAVFPAVASERELPPNTDPYSITYPEEDRHDVRAQRERDREKSDCAKSCSCERHGAKSSAPKA